MDDPFFSNYLQYINNGLFPPFFRIMISDGLLAAMVIIVIIVLLGFLLNLLHCVTSCLEGVPRGEEHEAARMDEGDTHWLISAAGNALYCVFCAIPCGLFCKNQNNVVLV